ncbi:MAG TPA: iron uptake system protein EfeO [Propionicimonas sp.]|jgi:iron uptake system component EfeO|uniref:iron uptake system protein EfeO n=1 Tax=Propionicimonas sp. TaxID=1955623 RepID=UPI002F40D2F1
MTFRVLALVCAALVAVAGCTDNAPAATGPAGDARALSVTSSDTACTLSATTAPSGALTFAVTNTGAAVTEFYLLAADGLRIVGEVENIGPGITRELVLSAPAGSYFSACKPGMVGEGIRAAFQVTDSGQPVGPTGDDAALVDAANEAYGAYVGDQIDQLLAKTKEFVTAYTAGDSELARTLYPQARVHWERVETVAESFGDLDPKMDAREADLEAGQKWTGWHRLEKDLWPARAKGYTPLTAAERKTYADDLLANTEVLHERAEELTFTADAIANGAKGLLDEVATGKVTGEEEYWSRTDLWDFQANVDGARVGWEGLRDLLKRKNPALDGQIETRFTGLQALLDKQRVGDGFVTYDKLTKAQVKDLSDAVNALSEPLSKMAGAVLS